MSATRDLIERYYAAFNAKDSEQMLACLSEDVAHDINQSARQVGLAAFRSFLAHMDTHYREQARELVVLENGDGGRAAAEFVIHGEYLQQDGDLPGASGQRYELPVGAFFEVQDSKITRVTNYYNLAEWIRQIEPVGSAKEQIGG
ncbi:ketosteroid isomerase-related protein [Deinococcus sp.]|uniref:ketosteroid isomerase-related protein n=1 Tax=Deinococcus sp. TaxID=47478 RepID=UPI003C7B528B